MRRRRRSRSFGGPGEDSGPVLGAERDRLGVFMPGNIAKAADILGVEAPAYRKAMKERFGKG